MIHIVGWAEMRKHPLKPGALPYFYGRFPNSPLGTVLTSFPVYGSPAIPKALQFSSVNFHMTVVANNQSFPLDCSHNNYPIRRCFAMLPVLL